MNQTATNRPTGYLFDDDFEDTALEATTPTTTEEIRKAAHIVNGGTEQFKCPACHGTGAFHSYTGRYVGPCYKCKGKGNISKGQAAAIKGKETKRRNIEDWQETHAAEIAYMRKRAVKSEFYQSFVEKLGEYGTLTENQLALVQRDMAKDAEFYAAKKKEREATVDTAAIKALFAKAVDNAVRKPVFRAEKITVSKAPDHGQNPGCLYVTDTETDTFYGTIRGNTFEARREATPEVYEALQVLAADPEKAAIGYARKFKRCFSCGNTLRNPVSVLAVIGPICAEHWGLEGLRDAAAEEYKAMKERGEGLGS